MKAKNKNQSLNTEHRLLLTAHCLLFTVLIALCLCASVAKATTNYVGQSGTPSGNYFTDIQSAVDAASDGDLILVSNGVYNSGETVTPGFALSNRVVITKNITVRSVNGPANTIILGAEAPGGGGNGDGAVRCVFMTDGAVYGFTMSNGFTHTSGSPYYDQSGGGVWLLTNGCVVTNCTISGNCASSRGGGAYCNNGGSLNGCIISGNSAGVGGGVRCRYGGSVSDCTISGNSANMGGGVYCNNAGVLSACTLSDNSAGMYGGGVYCNNAGVLSACTLSDNSAGRHGGGVYCNNAGLLSACTFIGNSAQWDGGGMYCNNEAELSACIISGNSAAQEGGGVYCQDGGALTNCLIYNWNSATFGGGAYLENGGEIFNCTIAGNYASDSGGGICTSNSGTIANSIIYDNQALSGNDNWLNYASGAAFSYCCTTPISGLPGGNKCISDNPIFVVPGSDYHLSEGSPCIDVGLTMPWMNPPATDLDGNPRIYNGTVDMGAYEYSGGNIPVTSPNWKLKNKKKKGVLKGKPITPLLYKFLTNGYGMGIWDLETDTNVDGPRQLTAKNKKETVWIFKNKTNKTAKIIYSEKYKKKKDIYKTKLKYILQGQIPESNMVYIAPL